MTIFSSKSKTIAATTLDLFCRGNLKFALLVCLSTIAASAQPPSWVNATSSAGSGASKANAIKVGPDNNQYVTGQFSSTVGFAGNTLVSAGGLDIFLAKYGLSGELLWIVQAGGTGDDIGYGVTLDTAGNVYVVGQFTTSATFSSTNGTALTKTGLGQTIFLAKYSSAGALVWVQTGSTGDQYANNFGMGVAVNSTAGTIYVAAGTETDTLFSSANGMAQTVPGVDTWHVALAKYDANGNFLWGQTNQASPNSFPAAVAVDANDNAYIVGWLEDTTTFNGAGGSITVTGFSPAQINTDYPQDAFLAKYDPNGNVQWVNHIGGYKAITNAVAVSPSGDVTMVGFAGNVSSYPDTVATSQPPGANINLGSGVLTNPFTVNELVATYNSAGVLETAFRRGSTLETATGVVYDSAGMYVSGLFEGTSGRTLSIQSYSGGTLLWEQTANVGGTWGDPESSTPALSLDAHDDVFVAGGYGSAASFGTIDLTGIGSSNTYVAELSASSLMPAVTLSNSSWTFAAHPLGVQSGRGEIFVMNTGKALLEIAGAQIIGGYSSFALTNNCPATLGIDDFCVLDFTITPTRTGEITAILQLNDNAPGSPQNIPIQGVGIGPALHVSNNAWDFGPHPVGHASRLGTVYATNSGDELLHFSSISITGQDEADFSIVSMSCGATLVSYTTCSVTFEFTPKAVGMLTAVLTFSHDGIPAQQSIALSGEGTAP